MIDAKDFWGEVSRCLTHFRMLNKYSNEDVRLALGFKAVDLLRKDGVVCYKCHGLREGHTGRV